MGGNGEKEKKGRLCPRWLLIKSMRRVGWNALRLRRANDEIPYSSVSGIFSVSSFIALTKEKSERESQQESSSIPLTT